MGRNRVMTQVSYLKALEREAMNAEMLHKRALRRADAPGLEWLTHEVAQAERRLQDARERVAGYQRVLAGFTAPTGQAAPVR